MLSDIDGRRGEKAGSRETSLAIPFIVVVNKLQGEHRLHLIKLSANYRVISIIRTSFSIVRPSIHIDIIDRLFYSSFSFFFLSFLFNFSFRSLPLSLVLRFLSLTNPSNVLDDRQNFRPTHRADTFKFVFKFVHLFSVQRLPHPVCALYSCK